MNLFCPTAKPTSLGKHSSLLRLGSRTTVVNVWWWDCMELKLSWKAFTNFWKCLVLNWAYSHISVSVQGKPWSMLAS